MFSSSVVITILVSCPTSQISLECRGKKLRENTAMANDFNAQIHSLGIEQQIRQIGTSRLCKLQAWLRHKMDGRLNRGRKHRGSVLITAQTWRQKDLRSNLLSTECLNCRQFNCFWWNISPLRRSLVALSIDGETGEKRRRNEDTRHFVMLAQGQIQWIRERTWFTARHQLTSDTKARFTRRLQFLKPTIFGNCGKKTAFTRSRLQKFLILHCRMTMAPTWRNLG